MIKHHWHRVQTEMSISEMFTKLTYFKTAIAKMQLRTNNANAMISCMIKVSKVRRKYLFNPFFIMLLFDVQDYSRSLGWSQVGPIGLLQEHSVG